jgi:hypothetical protein
VPCLPEYAEKKTCRQSTRMITQTSPFRFVLNRLSVCVFLSVCQVAYYNKVSSVKFAIGAVMYVLFVGFLYSDMCRDLRVPAPVCDLDVGISSCKIAEARFQDCLQVRRGRFESWFVCVCVCVCAYIQDFGVAVNVCIFVCICVCVCVFKDFSMACVCSYVRSFEVCAWFV